MESACYQLRASYWSALHMRRRPVASRLKERMSHRKNVFFFFLFRAKMQRFPPRASSHMQMMQRFQNSSLLPRSLRLLRLCIEMCVAIHRFSCKVNLKAFPPSLLSKKPPPKKPREYRQQRNGELLNYPLLPSALSLLIWWDAC